MSREILLNNPNNPEQHHIEEHQETVQNPNEELERKLFMQDLNKFMSESGKPLSKIPIMGYKELDLFQLFKEVLAFGGFNEVVKNVGTWSKIWKRLPNFDPSITDSSFRLKKNYERYLLDYEYKSNPDHRQQASETDKHYQKRGFTKEHSPSPPISRQHSFNTHQFHYSSPISIVNLTENNTSPHLPNNNINNQNNNMHQTNNINNPLQHVIDNNNNNTINNSNSPVVNHILHNISSHHHDTRHDSAPSSPSPPTIQRNNSLNSISNLLNADTEESLSPLPTFSFHAPSLTLSPSRKERVLKKKSHSSSTKLDKLASESLRDLAEKKSKRMDSLLNPFPLVSSLSTSSLLAASSSSFSALSSLAHSSEEQSFKIPRDIEGLPVLPIDLGEFVLESLGTIIPRPPFTTEKHVWPVGFRISRMFQSLKNPQNLVKYTCSILDGGDRPLFLVFPEDESKPIQSHSPSAVWKIVLKKLATKISTLNESPISRKNVNGNPRFGLSHPVVVQLFNEMLGVEKTPSASVPIPVPSPSALLRKRKSLNDLYSSSLEDLSPSSSSSSSHEGDKDQPMKFPRVELVHTLHSSEEIVFNTPEELDDLEIAVATLNALKFCTGTTV